MNQRKLKAQINRKNKTYNNFKKAIKEARYRSKILYGFETEVKININTKINQYFSLNPFCINLRNWEYEDICLNKITNSFEVVGNIKSHLNYMFGL